jgi:signal transduction histidine kinase
MGMQTMRYRARMIGASFDIRPNPRRGTVVTCTLRRKPAQKPRKLP